MITLKISPSCWDGVYASDGDYSTHVTYPSDGTNGYQCPTAVPKKFITIQFETVFAVYDFPFNGVNSITWVLANGDTSGYGIHGDFMNGWNPDTLAQVVNDCRYMNSTNGNPNIDDPANCPILTRWLDVTRCGRATFQSQPVLQVTSTVATLSQCSRPFGSRTSDTSHRDT
jgi:hypothetical protein